MYHALCLLLLLHQTKAVHISKTSGATSIQQRDEQIFPNANLAIISVTTPLQGHIRHLDALSLKILPQVQNAIHNTNLSFPSAFHTEISLAIADAFNAKSSLINWVNIISTQHRPSRFLDFLLAGTALGISAINTIQISALSSAQDDIKEHVKSLTHHIGEIDATVNELTITAARVSNALQAVDDQIQKEELTTHILDVLLIMQKSVRRANQLIDHFNQLLQHRLPTGLIPIQDLKTALTKLTTKLQATNFYPIFPQPIHLFQLPVAMQLCNNDLQVFISVPITKLSSPPMSWFHVGEGLINQTTVR